MTPADPTPPAAVAPTQNYEPEGVRFFDARSGREMLLVDDASPRYPGWLVYRHPDGQWVTLREATPDDRARVSAMNVPAAVAPTGGETLKPCPFCGWDAPRVVSEGYDHGPWYRVACDECGVFTTGSSAVFSAVADWNRRAALSSPVRAEPTELRNAAQNVVDRFIGGSRLNGRLGEAIDRLALAIVAAPVRAERGEAERRAETERLSDYRNISARFAAEQGPSLTPTPPATPTPSEEPTR